MLPQFHTSAERTSICDFPITFLDNSKECGRKIWAWFNQLLVAQTQLRIENLKVSDQVLEILPSSLTSSFQIQHCLTQFLLSGEILPWTVKNDSIAGRGSQIFSFLYLKASWAAGQIYSNQYLQLNVAVGLIAFWIASHTINSWDDPVDDFTLTIRRIGSVASCTTVSTRWANFYSFADSARCSTWSFHVDRKCEALGILIVKIILSQRLRGFSRLYRV